MLIEKTDIEKAKDKLGDNNAFFMAELLGLENFDDKNLKACCPYQDVYKRQKQYYDTAPKTNKKDFMIYVSENVPKEYQVYCRELYYGHDINVLKSGNKKSPRYKKLKEMGVDDYSMLFKEELKDV